MVAGSPLEYRYGGFAQEIICGPDAISGLNLALDRLGARRAMVICGPSILEGSDVVTRVQTALEGSYAGLFPGVAPPCASGNASPSGGRGP